MTIPEGLPFSRAYGKQAALTRDSKRFRIRLSAYMKALNGHIWEGIERDLELKGGFQLEAVGRPSSYWRVVGFIRDSPIDDLLDAITYIDQIFASSRGSNYMTLEQKEWREFISSALSEEGLAYRLDSRCGVRYYVDEEFERGRLAAVAELQDAAFVSVLSPTEDAFKYLEARPHDTKAAVRSIFEAVEVIAKVTLPDAPRLNNAWVKGRLKDAYLQGLDKASAEHKVVTRLFESLALWVDALHEYRHGHDEEVSVAPSIEVAIYVISTGCAHLRWLAPRAKQFAAARP